MVGTMVGGTKQVGMDITGKVSWLGDDNTFQICLQIFGFFVGNCPAVGIKYFSLAKELVNRLVLIISL